MKIIKNNDITQNTSSNIEVKKNNSKAYIFSPAVKNE